MKPVSILFMSLILFFSCGIEEGVKGQSNADSLSATVRKKPPGFVEGKGFLVPDQDISFPMYSPVDTGKYSAFTQDLNDYNSMQYKGATPAKQEAVLKRIKAFREYLKPMKSGTDAWACYLYARSLDLPPHGSDRMAGDSALKYYSKAAKLHLADAEMLLAQGYRYYFLGLKPDIQKATAYLEAAILHGSDEIKARGYLDLARAWYSADQSPTGKVDLDKAQEYLEKTLALNPDDVQALDFLGSIYVKKGLYEKAVEVKMRSGNEQGRLEVAEWLVHGENVPKDLSKGLAIMQAEAEKLGKNYEGYMGVRNPVIMLNKLYLCEKLITKEQVGPILLGTSVCD
jgi:tetratricopeptide (TPR) repeat protein